MASSRGDLSDPLWFKGSYSNESGGNCVEVAANLPGLGPLHRRSEGLLTVGRPLPGG
jgi:hypothetical protein